MPNTKSAAKTMRSSQRKRERNLLTISKYREAIKAVRRAARTKPEEAVKLLAEVYKQVDKAVKKNVIHKNKASRIKSRLTKSVTKK